MLSKGPRRRQANGLFHSFHFRSVRLWCRVSLPGAAGGLLEMTEIDNSGSRTCLWLLLALVFTSRLLVAIVIWAIDGPYGFWLPDTLSYLEPASSLLHGSFSSRGSPELIRTPGYPLLLIPGVASHHSALVAVAENILLATLSAWLIWRIANDIAPRSKAALWAVVLYCFEPVGFLYSEKILSDLPFSAELLLFVWLTLRFFRKPTYGGLAVSALSLSVATYIRPASVFLALWLAPLLLFLPRQLTWRQRLPRATAFVILFAMTLAPWILRNVHVADYWGFSAIAEHNLYFYSAAAVQAKLENKNFAQVQAELGWNNSERYLELHPEQRDWSPGKIFRFQSGEARRILSRHWLSYFVIHFKGCAIVLFDPAATEMMKVLHQYPEGGGLIYRATDQGVLHAAFWLIRHYPKVGAALLLLGAQTLLYYFLGIAGLRHLPLEVIALFVSLFAYFVLVSGSASAAARFRTPIMPLVCISAGVAIAAWQSRSALSLQGDGKLRHELSI